MDVQFRYTVAGAEHETWLTVVHDVSTDLAQDYLNHHPRNSTQVIRYNPANPDDILTRPAGDGGWGGFIAIAVGVLLMIGSGWWIWHGWRATA